MALINLVASGHEASLWLFLHLWAATKAFILSIAAFVVVLARFLLMATFAMSYDTSSCDISGR